MVRRADSSGTTFVFTQHLSAISEAWKNGPGMGTTVNWPSSDKFIASPKNDGVAATIKQTPGAIGYIEYGFAELGKLTMASLENKAGSFVKPTLESGKAALAGVNCQPTAGLAARPRWRRGLSDCHLYLDGVLQKVRRSEEGRDHSQMS